MRESRKPTQKFEVRMGEGRGGRTTQQLPEGIVSSRWTSWTKWQPWGDYWLGCHVPGLPATFPASTTLDPSLLLTSPRARKSLPQLSTLEHDTPLPPRDESGESVGSSQLPFVLPSRLCNSCSWCMVYDCVYRWPPPSPKRDTTTALPARCLRQPAILKCEDSRAPPLVLDARRW